MINILISFILISLIIYNLSLIIEPKRTPLKWQEPFYKDGRISPAGYLQIARKLQEEQNHEKH